MGHHQHHQVRESKHRERGIGFEIAPVIGIRLPYLGEKWPRASGTVRPKSLKSLPQCGPAMGPCPGLTLLVLKINHSKRLFDSRI